MCIGDSAKIVNTGKNTQFIMIKALSAAPFDKPLLPVLAVLLEKQDKSGFSKSLY